MKNEGNTLKTDENKNIITEEIQKIITNELLHFKEDILKEIKEKEINTKIINDKFKEDVKSNIDKIIKISDSLKIKVDTSYKTILSYAESKEKIIILTNYYDNIKYKTERQEVWLNLLKKDLLEAINKYDNILEHNIFYKGVIGNGCKFVNFHNFIDYILKCIDDFNKNFEKIKKDKENYKNDMQKKLNNINEQRCYDNANFKTLITQKQKIFEEKYKYIFDIKNDIDFKINEINKKLNELEKKLNEKKTNENINNEKENENFSKIYQLINYIQENLNEIKYLKEFQESEINKKFEKLQTDINNQQKDIKKLINNSDKDNFIKQDIQEVNEKKEVIYEKINKRESQNKINIKNNSYNDLNKSNKINSSQIINEKKTNLKILNTIHDSVNFEEKSNLSLSNIKSYNYKENKRLISPKLIKKEFSLPALNSNEIDNLNNTSQNNNKIFEMKKYRIFNPNLFSFKNIKKNIDLVHCRKSYKSEVIKNLLIINNKN